MKISQNTVVSIDYTVKDSAGNVIDSSSGGLPLEYIHGTGRLITGLEKELEGKSEGDAFSVEIAPKDAYGEYDDSLLIEVPRANFDADAEIKVGMKFHATSPGGPAIVKVTKVTDETVTVDANHELAGKTLFFDVKVVSVREATEDELNPPSGCGGGCGGCGSGGCGGGCSGGCGGCGE